MPQIDEEILRRLLAKVSEFPPRVPAGYMRRKIESEGFFEEAGLRFDRTDYLLGQYYSGLAVLARDMHGFLQKNPRDDATVFEDIVSLVNEEEVYGDGSFPQYSGLPVETLPDTLVGIAELGYPSVAELGDEHIVHEWTFKPGKRLFLKFGIKFKETVCGKDGPYEQFNHRLLNQASLPVTIAAAVLNAGFSAATFWYPLGVYVAILMVKTGLKTYCEPG